MPSGCGWESGSEGPITGRLRLDESNAKEADAAARGNREAWLDTATKQPEAMIFYSGLGYQEIGRVTRPEWHWTLVYYLRPWPPDSIGPRRPQDEPPQVLSARC